MEIHRRFKVGVGIMKLSEAIIIIYLNNVYPQLRTMTIMSRKLQLNFSNLSKTVGIMIEQKWIKLDKYPHKTYILLTRKGTKLIKAAKDTIKIHHVPKKKDKNKELM